MQEPKIIIEKLENWKGGNSTGYYEVLTNEIHVLNGDDLEMRARIHENIHASRRDHLTFKLASVFAVPSLRSFLFGLLFVLATVGLFTSLVPFLFATGLFLLFVACHSYEEYIADYETAQRCKELIAELPKTEQA